MGVLWGVGDMQFIKDFLEREKLRQGVVIKEFPNGTKYIHERDLQTKRVVHKCFKPLDSSAIDKLQSDVNKAKGASYIFPNWYRDFFKSTNGLNLFFSSIYFDGEQTPMIQHPIYGWTEAGIGGYSNNPIERENWMAPSNLRYTRLDIFDLNAQNRWLRIGAYGQDGSHINWDFKKNKIVVMYSLPAVTPTKELRKFTEQDYEQRIFAEWSDFETFFLSETERLAKIFELYPNVTHIETCSKLKKKFPNIVDSLCYKKTLPKGHKDYFE